MNFSVLSVCIFFKKLWRLLAIFWRQRAGQSSKLRAFSLCRVSPWFCSCNKVLVSLAVCTRMFYFLICSALFSFVFYSLFYYCICVNYCYRLAYSINATFSNLMCYLQISQNYFRRQFKYTPWTIKAPLYFGPWLLWLLVQNKAAHFMVHPVKL